MDRLERLLKLLAELLSAPVPLSREEIGQRVEGYAPEPGAFRRAFERDKEALRQMGIPVVVEPLDPRYPELGDGYRIPREDYELPDPGLTPDELAALHLAASAVRLEGVAPGTQALWKLGGAPSATAVDAVGAIAALPGSEHLPALFAAVAERRWVRFQYRGETRTVDAYRLSFRTWASGAEAGWWYLRGRDHARDADRSFRVDRIESTPETGPAGAFDRPALGPDGEPPPPWQMGDEEEVMARLLVDDSQASWAQAQLGSAPLEFRDEGSVVLEVAVTNRGAFRTFVLGLLDHAEVLGPAELRDDMTNWLAALARPA